MRRLPKPTAHAHHHAITAFVDQHDSIPFPLEVRFEWRQYTPFGRGCQGISGKKAGVGKVFLYFFYVLLACGRQTWYDKGAIFFVKGGNRMKFSTKDRYALRLMAQLADCGPEETLSLKSVSESQQISQKYLEQIVTPLSRAGLVISSRGSQGGYRLTRSPQEITAGDILRAIEGDLVPIPCLSSQAEACPRRAQCHTIGFWEGLRQVIDKYVDGITLEQLRTMRADDLALPDDE